MVLKQAFLGSIITLGGAIALHQATAAPAKPVAPPLVVQAIPLAGSDAAGVSTPSAENAWGGPRTDASPTLADRVVQYKIDASLEPVQHVVNGEEQLTWRNRSAQPIGAVYLHLYLNAFQSDDSTLNTERRRPGFDFRPGAAHESVDWGHIELLDVRQNGVIVPVTFVHPDGGPMTDHTVVRLDLPQAVAGGASTTLAIKFQDQLPKVLQRSGYFKTFHLIGQWFPKIAVLELPGERGATKVQWNAHEYHVNSEFYADYGIFDMHLKVPSNFKVGAVGEEVDPPVVEGGTTTHHFYQADVHDFAWAADSRFEPPLEGTYTGEGSPTVKVHVLFTPEYKPAAEEALKASIDALGYFSRKIGPYPYRSLTVIITPNNAENAGGMEYPTFFTCDGATRVDEGTYSRDDVDFTVIHEFGHGYFYGILGSNEFEEPMLDEGINEYWDDRMMADRHQPMHYTIPLLKKLGIELDASAAESERLTAMVHQPPDPIGANSWQRISSIGYFSVYSRTVLMLNDLQDIIGTEAMDKAFKAYYETWKYRHPSIADFRESLADHSGHADVVEKYFALEVYNARRIDDAVTSVESVELLPQPGTHEENGKWTTQDDKAIDEQVEKIRKDWHKAHPKPEPGTGPFPFQTTVTVRRYGAPVPEILTVQFADGSSEVAVWNDSKRWVRFSWTKPVKALSAQINAGHSRMLDADRFNDSYSIKSDSKPALRLSGDLASWYQYILSILVTQ
jgi:hypothetical protein